MKYLFKRTNVHPLGHKFLKNTLGVISRNSIIFCKKNNINHVILQKKSSNLSIPDIAVQAYFYSSFVQIH